MQAFRGQRPITLVALVVLVLLFGTISAWNIGDAGFSQFYSSAAHSMTVSWRAFFYGSFDPAATITLDKLSGFLVPQAIFARVFGFSATAIALPQVIEGMVTIVVVYVIGTRWRGPGLGMLAALAAASTPVLASMFGHVMEDGLLTMSLAVALLCWQTFALGGRTTPLVFSALWVAVGFQAKMMQAWLILPALVVGILLLGSFGMAARVRRALLFLGVAVAGSVLWMAIVQLVPAGSRPYFDGSTNNNVFSMVFGYNGFNRLVPHLIPGAAPDFIARVFGHGVPGASPAKLVLPAYASQVGWLYPIALAGVVLACILFVRGGRRLDATTVVGVVIVLWLGASVLLLTLATIPHTAYVAAVSVQVALLAGFCAGELWRIARSGGLVRRLPAAGVLLAQTAWVVLLLELTRVAPDGLVLLVGIVGAASALGVIALPVLAEPRRAFRVLAVTALIAIFAAPATWTASEVDVSLGGSANDAYGGPHIGNSPRFFRPRGGRAAVTTFAKFAVKPPVLSSPTPRLTTDERAVVAYTEAHVPRGGILFVTNAWFASVPYILDAGANAPSMGGFSESTPTPTLPQVRKLVRSGVFRYFLLPTAGAGARGQTDVQRAIEPWVITSCTALPVGGPHSGPDAPILEDQTLWDCRGR